LSGLKKRKPLVKAPSPGMARSPYQMNTQLQGLRLLTAGEPSQIIRSMKAKLLMWGLILVPVVYLLSLYLVIKNATVPADFSTADFMVKCGFVIGTFVTIILALFGDYLREIVFPIDLSIEDPKESNTVFDMCDFKEEKFKWECPQLFGKTFNVYCHHLRVKNLTPHRPINDCRVWLKKIHVEHNGLWKEENQDANGQWHKNKFAVPRLMEWAPSEYSRDKRTFSTEQVFDFGKTLSNNGGFMVTIWRRQGGTFNRLFPVGKKARFFLYATADNYHKEKEFCFEIEVPQSVPGALVTPARVTPA
jgi:hypothetical protein